MIMRPIVFRGMASDGQWHYGDLVTSEHEPTATIIEGANYYPVDPNSVGQFTGLYDDNNDRIFEGDIVLCQGEGSDKKKVGIMCYAYASFTIMVINDGEIRPFDDTDWYFSASRGDSIQVVGAAYSIMPELCVTLKEALT